LNSLILRKVKPEDASSIWRIIEPIIRAGVTYVFDPQSSKEKMLDYWIATDKQTYVAEVEGNIVGTFYLKANQPDRGSHVVNAGYMVSSEAAGKGIGKAMAEFSFVEAKRLGFCAMQFNYVVKTNTVAVNLWKKLGFQVVGEIPEAFDHPVFGLTNVYVMHRKL
jgi:L-amino acid N-acyltransferase YncA